MFKRFTNACVRVVNRWLPDAFLFAVILTFVVYVAAMFATGMGPIKVLAAWGNSDGFWGLLAFSMQMALVLVLGSAMASAKPCKKVLRKAAGLCHNNMQAIVITTMVSTVCCWLNWGFGLVAGALLLAGEELLPAGAVGAALGSPLILLGITGGLFLIRLAQLPGLVFVLLRDLLCLAASCRRQGFYLPLCIRLDALGDPFQSLHGLLRFTECW